MFVQSIPRNSGSFRYRIKITDGTNQ